MLAKHKVRKVMRLAQKRRQDKERFDRSQERIEKRNRENSTNALMIAASRIN